MSSMSKSFPEGGFSAESKLWVDPFKMKTATRPQYHRLQRILEMVREGTRAGSLPNCGHFTRELEVSRRTLMRDLDFLRDDHNAPIAYDDSRKGFKLTDPTFKLAPVELTRREVFSFSIARKLLERFVKRSVNEIVIFS
jgi:predicted DNA-binding transcriptional regulator YafY